MSDRSPGRRRLAASRLATLLGGGFFSFGGVPPPKLKKPQKNYRTGCEAPSCRLAALMLQRNVEQNLERETVLF